MSIPTAALADLRTTRSADTARAADPLPDGVAPAPDPSTETTTSTEGLPNRHVGPHPSSRSVDAPRAALASAALLTLAVALTVLAGCTWAPSPAPVTPAATPTTSGAPSATASTSAPTSTTSAPSRPTTAMGLRCDGPDVAARVETLAGPSGQRLTLSTVGSGPTVALLLHQTDRVASCGWWPYANRMADAGIRAVLLDFCGYGTSTCDPQQAWSTSYPDQVTLAATHLRAAGATRLVLVGASFGGTVASVSAAQAKADAVVNLSGFGFGTMDTAPAVAALTIPVMGVGSHSEETDSAKLQREINGSASSTKRFLWADVGHGWNLVLDGPFRDAPLTPIGRAVIAWVAGDYTPS